MTRRRFTSRTSLIVAFLRILCSVGPVTESVSHSGCAYSSASPMGMTQPSSIGSSVTQASSYPARLPSSRIVRPHVSGTKYFSPRALFTECILQSPPPRFFSW